jgi:hypothetical protein
MNRPLLLALAAISLTHAEAALAGSTCGGGGGSDSGSGSGSDSGSGSSFDFSDSGSSSDAAPACVDATDIVGYRRCKRFGGWASHTATPVLLELGAAVRTFGSPLGTASGHVSHDSESFSYRVVGTPTGRASTSPPTETAVVTTARLGFGLRRGVYLAGEGELGGLVHNASRAEMTSTGMFGAPSITPSSSLVLGALAVAGVRGDTRRGTFGAEVVGGVRSVAYYYESRYLACVNTTSHAVTSPVLEARARASLWLSPYVSVGASAGASVIDRGAWVTGLHLGLVTKPYGNLRD